MTESNTQKTNPALGFLWANRNPMQRTGNAGLAAGLILGLAGAPTNAVIITPIAAAVLYNRLTKNTGAKKHGFTFLAVCMTFVTVTVGGLIGSGISGKEWLPAESSPSTTSVPVPTAEPEVAEPVASSAPRPQTTREINSDNCTSITGMTLEQAQQKLGEGKLVSATGASEYMPAIRMYNFGNAAFGGACSVMVQGGRVESATFMQF